MSDKLIWSNNMTQDYLANLSEEALRAILPDYGYDEEMLNELDHEGLINLVADDDYMWQNDSEEFEYNIAPEIAKQAKDGIILLNGTSARWGEAFGAGIAAHVEDLVGGDICRDCDNVAIYEDEHHNLYWEASHHDGTHHMDLFALPSDELKLRDFVATCMQDAVDDQADNYDIDYEEAILDVINDLDKDYINNYCDFSKVPEVCEPIKASMNLHIEGPAFTGEEPIEVYKEDINDKPLGDDLPSFKDRKAGYGYGRSVSKHGGYGYGEDLEEAKAKNPDNLKMELQSIKDDYEDFGPEGFYAVPFKRFEKQYPEFTKTCIRTYLKELDILEPEELDDPEIYEQYWQSGELILPDDWPVLIKGANLLVEGRNVAWEKILKSFYTPYDKLDSKDKSLEEKFDHKIPYDGQEFVAHLFHPSCAYCEELEEYGYYQGDVNLETDYEQERLAEIGAEEGDYIILKAVLSDSYEPYPFHLEIVGKVENESLKEGLLDQLFASDIPVEEVIEDAPVEVAAEVEPQVDCTMEAATNVMAAYQNANKWLDIIKEIVYHNMGCVFFSSFIHELAHTMPARFDKFGDILHTVNMRIPYPATQYIPTEPTDIDGVFAGIFMTLDSIKTALNEFIKCTDETAHGMACAAEGLLNDIEGEYPTIFRMQQEWANCGGDMAKFDKYVGQFIEHKDELLA